MKEFWTIITEKFKELEAGEAILITTILIIFTVGMSTIVLCKFFKMFVEIAQAFGGQAHV